MTKWDEIKARRDQRSPGVQDRIDRERILLALERQLYELRRSRGVSQERLGDAMGTSQENVSRIERVRDPHLSTLDHYVTCLGGRLEIKVVFDDDTVELVRGI